jgi:hypothetical protein
MVRSEEHFISEGRKHHLLEDSQALASLPFDRSSVSEDGLVRSKSLRRQQRVFDFLFVINVS